MGIFNSTIGNDATQGAAVAQALAAGENRATASSSAAAIASDIIATGTSLREGDPRLPPQTYTASYLGRQEALFDVLASVSARDGAEIVAEVIRQDPDAMRTWMRPAQMWVYHAAPFSDSNRGSSIVGFQNTMEALFNAGNGDSSLRLHIFEQLDLVRDPDSPASLLPGASDLEQNRRSGAAATAFAFMGVRPSVASQEFREAYAGHIMETQYSSDDRSERVAAANFAPWLLYEGRSLDPADSGRAEIDLRSGAESLIRVFSGFVLPDRGSVTTRADVSELADFVRVGGRFGQPSAIAPTSEAGVTTEFMNALARLDADFAIRSDSLDVPTVEHFAASIARVAGDNPEMIRASPQLQAALGQVFAVHGDAILSELTSEELDIVGSIGGRSQNLRLADAERLGNIWTETIFGEDVAEEVRNQMQGAIVDFVSARAATLSSEDVSLDEQGNISRQLGTLAGSVASVPLLDQNRAAAATQERADRITMVANLVAVPIAGAAGKLGSQALGQLVSSATGLQQVGLRAAQGVVGKSEDEILAATRNAIVAHLSASGSTVSVETAANEFAHEIREIVTFSGGDGWRESVTNQVNRVTDAVQK